MSAGTVPLHDGQEASSDAPGRVLLHLAGIGRNFPGVRALDGVEVRVRAGEVHGIVGENGAGKSTLMAIASGALAPSEGTVTVDGEVLAEASPPRARALGVSVVRQEPALLPDLTVAENLYLGMSADRRPATVMLTAWARDVLGLWSEPLAFSASDRVEQLDMQQRFIVEICRAFAQEPKVLVLDEPTEHLQDDEVRLLFGLIRAHVAKGNAVVYISHRIHEVKEISDTLSVLRNGRDQGSFATSTLSEQQIVAKIIGRELNALFPAKREPGTDEAPVLQLDGFTAPGVAPLDLTVVRGEIIGLAGIEGNGQRDLLRALAGIGSSGGVVRVEGVPHPPGALLKGRAPIAFVPSDRHSEGIAGALSVRENAVARHLRSVSTMGWTSRREEDALTRRVIDDLAVKTPTPETPIDSLSGGNQQKVLVGSVIAGHYPVILVDEPTQGVDIGARSEIYRALRDAASAGAAVLVLSSDALELAGLVDRVLVFSRGEVIDTLSGDEVTEENITSRALHATNLRARSGNDPRRVLRWFSSDAAPLVIVATLIVTVSALAAAQEPLFLGPRSLTSILALSAILALVGIGQVFVLLTGGIDLSVGPLMSVVVTIGSFYLVNGMPIGYQLVGWALMIGVPVAIGVTNWVLVEIVKLNAMIATLATFMALQGIALVMRPIPAGSVSQFVTAPINSVLGVVPVLFLLAVGLAVAGDVLLARSRWGISLRAVGSSAERARVNGLHPPRARLGAYVMCSVMAGIAGIALMAQIQVGDPTSGNAYTLTSITAAVLGGASAFGGRGFFSGAVLGAVLVQLIGAAATFLHLPTAGQYFIVGGLTIVAVAAYSITRRRVVAAP